MQDLTEPSTGEITPIYLVSDNGPCFKSSAFARFIASRPELTHIRTRNKSPQTNEALDGKRPRDRYLAEPSSDPTPATLPTRQTVQFLDAGHWRGPRSGRELIPHSEGANARAGSAAGELQTAAPRACPWWCALKRRRPLPLKGGGGCADYVKVHRFVAADAVAISLDEGRLRSRTMGVTWLTGSALVLLTLLLPAHTATWAALTVSVPAILGAAVMLVVQRLPAYAFEAFVGLGALLVTILVLADSSRGTPYSLFYLWITVQAFYFLPVSHAAAHLGFVALCLAVALSAVPAGSEGSLVFALVLGTVTATGAFVALLRRRIDVLVNELRQAALCDPLTGLLNRRGFLPLLDQQLQQARRVAAPLSLLAIDLDNFKGLNDRHGHAAGDRALLAAAGALRSVCRRSDVACRMGGDEFVVLLPATGANGAAQAADRVRHALDGAAPPVAASIGTSTFPGDGFAASDLLGFADQELYRAKTTGRIRS